MRNREDSLRGRVVYLPYERTMGYIVGAMGAFYTNIYYVKGGTEFEVLMENDEFILCEDDLDEDQHG